jgi:hypothetical protein
MHVEEQSSTAVLIPAAAAVSLLMERWCSGFQISVAATGGQGSAVPAASSVGPTGAAQLDVAAAPLRTRTMLALFRSDRQKISAA